MRHDLDHLLRTHEQKQQMSCSASAHEFVAKLHKKIADSDYPLQSGLSADKAGFGFGEFLDSIGFESESGWLSPTDALAMFRKETAEGRYPLIAISTGPGLWHITVAVPTDGGVGIIDPQNREFIARDADATLKVLQATADAVADRPNINYLTYKSKVVSPAKSA